MTRHRLRTWTLVFLAVCLSVACSRGADEARLAADLQTRLDRDVKPGLFTLVGLRREGSGPLPAGESGAARVVIYFNATLKIGEDYRFGGWDNLSPSSVAFALGATDKGIFGVHPENRAGDLVRAYGSAIYEHDGNHWVPTTAARAQSTAAPDYDGTAPPSRSKQLIDRLAAMVELPPPGVPPQQDEIIAEELARASENIERRVRRRQHTFTIASGPPEGEYARFAQVLVDAVRESAPGVNLRQRHTEGSMENVALIAKGEADYAIVQGDVAAAALEGGGPLGQVAALDKLRAVGGLFPEAIHVVVPADSTIREIFDLRGRRVNIGTPSSGSHYDALAVLEAYGLKPQDLADVQTDPLPSAIDRLKRRRLDALFVTASAPTRPIQQLATTMAVRFLSVKGPALEQLAAIRQGLSPIVLPPNTYPGQKLPTATVASAALLVTTVDAPEVEVERVSELVFTRIPRQRSGNADMVRVSAQNELRGVTIPLHPGAGRPKR